MRLLATATLTALAFSTPAWADGAFALGYTQRGELVWGMEYGYQPDEIYGAAERALQTCQSQSDGSECTELRLELRGMGAWLALATPEFIPGRRSPYGEFYSASRDTAAQKALVQCEERDGNRGHCRLKVLKQNVPVITYHTVPGTGTSVGQSNYDITHQQIQNENQNLQLYGTAHPGWTPAK